MVDRSALGFADVGDAEFADMVAAQLGLAADEIDDVTGRVERVEYDLPAITTAARFWVRGEARTPSGRREYAFFVKHVQSWGRSPLFADVAEEARAFAEANVPWRTEPTVYRSELAQRVPDGLTMARCFGVFDLDEKAAAIWLEEIPACRSPWDLARYEHAAFLLGRFAASPRVAAVPLDRPTLTVRDYYDGRLTHQVLPMLRSDIWQHPAVAAAYGDELRRRLLRAVDQLPDYVEEATALPHGMAHGDACPNNLLVVAGRDGFTMIDFAFLQPFPIGFDLSQLIVGDVQVGKRCAAELPATYERVVPAFVDGLRAEGCDVPESTVRRAQALLMLIFTGLSSLPWELLDADPPNLAEIAAERARIARFSLDLVDATS